MGVRAEVGNCDAGDVMPTNDCGPSFVMARRGTKYFAVQTVPTRFVLIVRKKSTSSSKVLAMRRLLPSGSVT
jgi:hypothetical protein